LARKKLKTKSIPYILLLGVLFGTTLTVSRFTVDQIAPTTYIGLRFILASLVFVVIFTFRLGRRQWPRGDNLWGHGFFLGVFGTAIPMTGIISSLQYLSSGLVSILITVNPAFTVLMAHFFLADEPLTRRKSLGILLALSGAVLLVIRGESGLPDVESVNPVGYSLVLGGMFANSAMTIYTRKFMQDFDTFDMTGIRMFTGALVLIPFSLIVDGFDVSEMNWQGVLAVLFAAIVGSFFGMLLSLNNIQRFGATAAVMTTYVIPIVAGLIGVIFLDERITWGMMVGIMLIILGVWFINTNIRKKIPEPYP
jgi:drug/metabolite transporter (DMT)-like permease